MDENNAALNESILEIQVEAVLHRSDLTAFKAITELAQRSVAPSRHG